MIAKKFLKAALLPLVFCLMTAGSLPAAAQTFWGAIAYNDRGATGMVWRRTTREQAEADAMRICAKNATVPCRVIAGAGGACMAATLGRRSRGSRQAGFSAVRVGLNQARNAAMVACFRRGFINCRIRNFMCADGSHKRR